MKKLIILVLLIFPLGLKAQNEIKKTYKNEFGIDATSFVLRFLKLNFDQFDYLQTYYLTYRRKFEKGNMRFALGGEYTNEDVPAYLIEDQNKYHYNSLTLITRIGWEFKNDISKKWQVFYGADFRPVFIDIKEDASFWNAGYANGIDYQMTNYGLAPVLGFRFRLNDRLSLSTETSLAINFQKENRTNYYTPITSDYPALPSEVIPTINRVFTSFHQPLMVFITFDI